MKAIRIYAALTLWLVASSLSAQTLHFLIVADTADASIGGSTLADLKNMQAKAREIAQNTGMKLNLKVLKSPEFNYNTTLAAVQAINPGSNDTVFFYYSGHGYRTKESKTVWPNMYTKTPPGKEGLEFSKVLDILDQKKPRLVIALGDLCNYSSDQSERSVNSRAFAEIAPENYKKLFVEYSGRVYASGSKPGQYSFAMDDGGAFTNQFLQALGSELRADDPNWKRLMSVATKSIKIGSPEQPTQDPIFELVEGGKPVVSTVEDPQNPEPATPTENVEDNQQEVTTVVDEDKQEEEDYKDEALCTDLKSLLDSLNQLQGVPKPNMQLTQGDKLYGTLQNVNQALDNVAEAYGDPKLTKETSRLDSSLESSNMRGYKSSLGKIIDYFQGVSQKQCSN